MNANWIAANPGFALVGWCGQEFDEPIIAWRISPHHGKEKNELSSYYVEPLTAKGFFYGGYDRATVAVRWPDGKVDFAAQTYKSVEQWRESEDWQKAVQTIQNKVREQRGF